MTDGSPEHGAEEPTLPGLEDLAPPTLEERIDAMDGPAQVIAAVRAHVAEHNRQATSFGKISADRRRTMERRALIDAGWHPLTGLPLMLDPDATCGTCAHRYDRGRFHKCDTVRETSGPGTDLRLWWPACTRYEPEESTDA